MKKNKPFIIIISATALLLLTAILVLCTINSADRSAELKSVINADVIIEDGKCEKTTYSIPFEIDKAHDYEVNVRWWPESNPGFLTGCCIKDSEGNILCGATGQKLDWNGQVLKLKPGRHTFEFTILASAAECDEYIRTVLPDAEMQHNYFTDYRDGHWDLDYTVSIYKSSRPIFITYIIIMFVFGICLSLLIALAFNNKNTLRPEYDERQRIARYKSGTVGFVVVIALLVIRSIFDLCDIPIPAQESIITMFIILIGIAVMAIYGIVNDGYYDLNTSIKKYTIFFSVFGSCMLILGIIAGFRGALFNNGVLTMAAVIPLSGAVSLAVGIATVIKGKCSREDDEE